MAITTVLLDLDGVVRHFDPGHVASVESKHNLSAGSLTETAFDPELLIPVITGLTTRADWFAEVGRRVNCAQAARDWTANIGSVDQEMIDEVDRLRSTGTKVAILTNGTNTIPAEMEILGLTGRFDRIFSTSEIGFAKPDKRAFQFVCDGLGVDPTSVFFTDDSPSKLSGAIELGMTARLFEGVPTFRGHLAELQ